MDLNPYLQKKIIALQMLKKIAPEEVFSLLAQPEIKSIQAWLFILKLMTTDNCFSLVRYFTL